MKGRLDVAAYIRDILVTGRWHRLSCVHDSFQMDNRFNRILKHTTRLLLGISRDSENQRMLGDTLFLLDDVSDLPMTSADCDKVHVNPLFTDMDIVLNLCRIFLSYCVIRPDQNGRKSITFLVPMERLFEEFVFGFLKSHFKEMLHPERQKRGLYLAKVGEKHFFELIHDIVMTRGDQTLVIDTKYKKIYFESKKDKQDKVSGISPGDMYQMVSYAVGRGSRDVYLLYPDTASNEKAGEILFEIRDMLVSEKENTIRIRVHQLPVIHQDFRQRWLLAKENNDLTSDEGLDWDTQEARLKEKLEEIFKKEA